MGDGWSETSSVVKPGLDDPEPANIRAVDRFLASGDESGSAPGDRKFRPDVEGLRAVAVLLVVLYHAGVPRLTGGFVGVDVFFVLSGFVITGLSIKDNLMWVLVALGLSIGSYFLIENPIRHWSFLARSGGRSITLGAILIGLSLGVATFELATHP